MQRRINSEHTAQERQEVLIFYGGKHRPEYKQSAKNSASVRYSAKSASFSFTIPPQSTIHENVNLRFGSKLRTLRRQQHWTQLQMADLLGINRSYISEIERGVKSISLSMLEIIALGFNMSLEELLRDV